MRMTTLDIQNHQFASRWRGYDPQDVDAFLKLVASDYESLALEAQTLREKVRHLESRIEDLAVNENALRETLITAQAMTEELKRSAIKESELLMGEAEVKAEKMIDAAHRRTSKLSQDLREMKQLRSRLAGSIRSTIETHLSLLDRLAEPASDELSETAEGYGATSDLLYATRGKEGRSDAGEGA